MDNTTNPPSDGAGGFWYQTNNPSSGHSTSHDNHDVGPSPGFELAHIGTRFGLQYPGWNTNNPEPSITTISHATHTPADPNLAADLDNTHEIDLGSIRQPVTRRHSAIEQFDHDSAHAVALAELQRNTPPPLPLPNSPAAQASPLLTTQNLFSRIPTSVSTRSEPVTRPTQTINDPESLSASSQHRRLACPYYKLDSYRHRDCVKFELGRIRDIRQHLFRKHCDQHGITKAQQEDIARPAKRRIGECAQWFAIWDILFPKAPQPDSPYTLGYHGETAKQISLLQHERQQQLTSSVLAALRATGDLTSHIEQILPEVLTGHTTDLLGMWCHDLTAATSYSAPSEPDDMAQSSTGRPQTSLPTLVSAPSVAPTDDLPEEPSSMWRHPPHASQPQHLGPVPQSEGDATNQYSNLVTSTGTQVATSPAVQMPSSPWNRHSPDDFLDFDPEQYEQPTGLDDEEKSHFDEAMWALYTNL